MSDDDMFEDPLEEDEEDEMDFQDLDDETGGEEAYNDTQATLLKRDKSFEVLSEAEISEEATKLLGTITDILGLPHPSIAGILLRHFKWNRDALIQAFTDNPDKVCLEAGVASLQVEKPVTSPKNQISCLVCLETVEEKDTFALGCGHRYCLPCWKTYLELKIAAGPDCIFAKCMNPTCPEIVNENAVKKLVADDKYSQFKRFMVRSFVADNPLVKWCPAPNCTYSVRCERKARPVTCKCGFSFCFNCCDYKMGDHTPATCSQVERWLHKASDESENVNWLLSNTKRCPQCRAPIEKNGGCMHMVCHKNSGGCGYEFCWLCRGNWTDHGRHTGGYYSCNKYDKSDAKSDDDKSQDIKTELECYMFYYHRYQSHHSARKVADEQRKKADKKGLKLQQKFEVRYQETKFLLEATEQLITNRRILEYSYVYGYYLDKKKTAEKNLFEDLQENLEKHTNFLSELYEMKLKKLTSYQLFYEWKEKVTNYTRVTHQFAQNFVDGVSRGLTSA
eukprot:TRINITY_DN7744_c0_g1_i1.p1 TRINITY_DN7744_c0_g1~~TRINITY_DN7744_c0_g1_i1.p1  ORF type:complete len:506 (-),score=82.98 TRINITY_DN7744_c0_g1_i1:98-1615(-)